VAATVHLYEIFIRAPRQQVWDALTDPSNTVHYFHGTRFESTATPGEPFKYVIDRDNRDAVEGIVEVFEEPHRLVMTWHVLYDEEMAQEPPSRVEWTLVPANDDGSVTRVTLRHGDLALSPKTWQNVRLGWVQVIDGLKTWLETGESLPDVDASAGDINATAAEGEWHRSQAITANNSTWELLDGRKHTSDEADDLLQRAYAAAYHWGRASNSTVVNQARASWLVSRAHVVLGHGEVALYHAERCAQFTAAADDAADFDRGFAQEARARALACLGRLDEAGTAYRDAAAVAIADADDRSIFEGDLHSEPWFGLGRASAG
jgi:uncharacterized protein YndB with AHSA1/START domain